MKDLIQFRKALFLSVLLATCFISSHLVASPLQKESANQRDQFLSIRVTNPGGETLEDVTVEAWTPDGFAARAKTDMGGEVTLNAAQFKSRYFVTAISNGKLGGVLQIDLGDHEFGELYKLELSPLKTIDAFLLDFDTGRPIPGATAEVWPTKQGHLIGARQKLVSDKEGKIELKGMLPGCYVQLQLSADNFHTFGKRRTLDYEHRERNGVRKRLEYELISDKSFQRTIERAKLKLPDVQSLSDAEAIEVLTKNFAKSKTVFNNSNVTTEFKTPKEFVNYMDFPVHLYRQAIWVRAKRIPGQESALKGLSFLIRNFLDNEVQPKPSNAEVASLIVEHHTSSPNIDPLLSSIRSFHPDPDSALWNIIRENPERKVRAGALKQLHYNQSNRMLRKHGREVRPKDLAELQKQAREVLMLMRDEYADCVVGINSKPLGEFAKQKLKWFDKYTIGATAPNFSGDTIENDEKISLHQYHGQVVVLHFLSSRFDTDFNELSRLAEKHKSVQLVGIVSGDRERAAKKLRKAELSWPTIWDGCFFQDESGVRWGDELMDRFKQQKTIVFDRNGKIRAAMLTGQELAKAVDDLVAEGGKK